VAKSILTPGNVPHLCYCFTPMRYAWDQFDAYFGPARLGRIGSAAMRPVMARMARWDRETSNRPDRYVAISHYVAGRIARYYNRGSSVIYPPVDTEFFHPDGTAPEPFALIVSALVPYKRIDLAIEACDLAHVPLKIVGDGPERSALARLSNGRAEFLGRLSNDDVRALYRRASVIVLPGEEDFGIVPLEAQACGRPVVALGRGGALETVLPGTTGALIDDLSVDAFASGIAEVLAARFDPVAIREHASHFGRERFGDQIEALVTSPIGAGQ
jgi:glycosyltransferase involved in cell wall biosynthesis